MPPSRYPHPHPPLCNNRQATTSTAYCTPVSCKPLQIQFQTYLFGKHCVRQYLAQFKTARIFRWRAIKLHQSMLRFTLLDRDMMGYPADLLRDAFDIFTDALGLRPSGVSLNNRAVALQTRYERIGSMEDLERAIEIQTKVLGLRPPGHEDRDVSLNNLAVGLKARYDRMGDLSDLERAIEMHTEALELRPPGHENRGSSVNNLAVALKSRYDRTGNQSDLERIIEMYSEALKLHLPGHQYRGSSLNNLAVALKTRYNKTCDLSDLERVIEMHTEALELRPPGHEDRGSSLNNLAVGLKSRYDRSGNLSDIERVIEMHTEALEFRPPGHRNHGSSLSNLAVALQTRYERIGSLKDLERVIEMLTEALELHPPGHENHESSLSNLAVALNTRYDRMGNLLDLERVIEMHTKALGRRPPGHQCRGSSLNNLAIALQTRYGKMADLSDLERVIEMHTETLELRPPGHEDRGVSLNNLAVALKSRYDRKGNLSDLERVIEMHTEALKLRPPGHQYRGISLNNLALALSTRYNKTCDLSDLERVVEMHTEALGLHPPGHGRRSLSLNNLAMAISTRYDRMGNLSDLERVIEMFTEALELHPPGHGNHESSLSNLAVALNTRYDRMGNLSDLERVIEMHTEALELRPPGHQYRGMSLNNLAKALRTGYNKTGDLSDLERAIEMHTEALELHPSGHEQHGMSLYYLAITLSMLYDRMGDLSDLYRVIDMLTEVLELVPPGHMYRAEVLAALSSALWRAEKGTKDKVLGLLNEGSRDLTSTLNSSLKCADLWVQYGRKVGDRESVNEAYDSMIYTLSHHLPVWPTLKLQYDALRQRIESLRFPMDAAAHAIETGDVERAVELLDASRSLLWSEFRRFRKPLLQSEFLDKKLAEEFEAVCSDLQGISTVEARYDNSMAGGMVKREAGGTPGVTASYEILLRRKRELMDRYQDLLRRIKETKGLERFLERDSFRELRAAANEGPVIIVNCSEYGSHVIFVFADRPPSFMQLDDTFRSTAQRLHDRLEEATNTKGPSELLVRVLKEISKFLWEDVVEGVVEKLREEKVPEGSRVWWCPTSFLTRFPFHAAGNKKNSLIDFYMSSYTPTLKALIDARKPSSFTADSFEPPPKILVVAQTQESSKLPAASEELDVMRNLGSVKECLDQEKATGEAVLERLQSHNWAHFICHGRVSASPFDSSLILYEGNLSFNDIIKSRLSDAKFAFLAACHTAGQSPDGLPDEALHLSAAMFFTGFRSVVGTLWRMMDEDGPEIARMFYEEMLREDLDDNASQKPRHTRAAYALWKVTKELKNAKKVGIDRWANFVHIGA